MASQLNRLERRATIQHLLNRNAPTCKLSNTQRKALPRMKSFPRLSVFILFILLSLDALWWSSNPVRADDWPMWRHDAGRTNVSSEAIPTPLHIQWKRQLPPVQPAFRKARLQFDQGYEPIVMGDTLFLALPHIDAVAAYAADTGKEQWRFYTEGPVRLAPVAWRDKLYFGSDDGHLYCLNAADGALHWKFRAVPSKRKIMGNGRLISVWPIRGGPVIADGTIYFAAGVWPLEGVFVYALDAESGKVVWVNDRAGSLFGRQPHQGTAIGGLSPQGYLLVNGDELVVPCGTARPATLNRQTGKLINFSLPGEGRMPGGWFMWADTQEARDIRRGKIRFDSHINRERHEDKEQLGKGVPGAKTRITLGGASLDYPEGFEGVDGKIHSVLVANSKLFITTRDGTIYCFGTKAVTPKTYQLVPRQLPVLDDALKATVADLMKATHAQNGYALVLGTREGSLAHYLAAHTSLNVIALTPQQKETDILRRRLMPPSNSGGRLSFLTGRLTEIGLPPYLANLIVAEDWDATGLGAGADYVLALYERLRPYGGIACLTVDMQKDDEIRTWLHAAGHREAEVQRAGDYLLIRRKGGLPGAVDYTRDWRAPDALVRAPLGILWFDDAIAHFKRAPQPYILSGVMISQDKDWKGKAQKMGSAMRAHVDGTGRFQLLDANYMDIYTGRLLSRKEAVARLKSIPNQPDKKFRPPYQYRPPYVDDLVRNREAKGTKPARFPFQRQIQKGKMTNPITGVLEARRFVKSYGCDGGNDYGHLITMRSATPAFYDKRIESGTINISGPRSGCTNSIIPAGGVLNLPYFYDGCTCSYPLPTGAALVSMPQTFEQWTSWGRGSVGPIVRIGINLGAPGDRMTHQGTLFLDFPSVGGPSPEITLQTQPKTPNYFYHHALFTEGGKGWPWVCASGAEGLTSLRLAGLKPGSFTVRLYFIDPKHTVPGERIFDVALQGKTVLKNFDVVADAGGRMRCTVREFADVEITDTCELTFSARIGAPLLSGIELVSTGLTLDSIAIVTKLPPAQGR